MRPPEYDRQWALLESMLPEGWREKARETGAIQRQRGLADPTSLLRLELMHVATGLSLRSTVARARAQDLAHMSDVGLLDRMRRSERWLRWMTTRLFTRSRY